MTKTPMTKTLIAGAAVALAMIAGVATAQPTTSTTSTTTTTTTTGGYSIDSTPIETMVADPAAKAVLDKDIPGMTTHPAYDQFKSMTLKGVEPMSQGAITDDMLAKTQADLSALPPK